MLDINEIVDESQKQERDTSLDITLPLDWTFPEVIDNTARSAWRKCETYSMYQTFNKIKPQTPSIHLHAGAAFAKGIEMTRRGFYEQKLSIADARKLGVIELIKAYGDFETLPDSTKSCERMVLGLIAYFDQYPLDSDYLKPYYSESAESYGIEFSFALPIEDETGSPLLHPVTGNPLLYAGKFDMLGQAGESAKNPGALFVVDEKTTAQLGNSWLKQWGLDSQFTGYCWGARSYGLPVAGAVIRGVSFLKSGNGHAEATIFRPDWQIQRWHREMVRDVKRMIRAFETRDISMALDKSICGNYGGCSFSFLCESPNPQQWIPLHFQKNTWNPLHREEA